MMPENRTTVSENGTVQISGHDAAPLVDDAVGAPEPVVNTQTNHRNDQKTLKTQQGINQSRAQKYK